MPTIRIDEPGKPRKWIKNLDKVEGTVTFTENRAEAYVRDGSFYCNSEVKTLRNPIMWDHEKYPELQYAVMDGGEY